MPGRIQSQDSPRRRGGRRYCRGHCHGADSSSVDFYRLEAQWTDEFRERWLNACQQWQRRHGRDRHGNVLELECVRVLIVPRGYVSGTFLSNSATWSGKTFATLGVTPGTYVWTWGTGANQNFTLQIKTPGPASTAIWYLNNNAFVARTGAPTLPVGWIVVGVADFNGDSQPDYLLYNTSTHQTAVWYLNNNVFVGGAFGPTLPANWKVVGVADFDGDGRPDYLLFNSTSHQTAIWYLSGTTLVRGAFGPSLPNGWDLVAVGDFNADGKPDYVLYAPATGQTAIWYLNNNVFVSGVLGPTLAG